MSTTRGSAHFYAGLLPVEPLDEPYPVRSTTILENDPLPKREPSRKRPSRPLSRFLMTFCIGVAATLAWQSYGDAARQVIANSYPQLGWLAPRRAPAAQKAPNIIALAASPAPHRDDHDLPGRHAMRQSIDQIAASQEQITRTIEQIATSIAIGQEQTTRLYDQPASSAQVPSAKASDVTVGSRVDGASLQPTVRLDIKSTE